MAYEDPDSEDRAYERMRQDPEAEDKAYDRMRQEEMDAAWLAHGEPVLYRCVSCDHRAASEPETLCVMCEARLIVLLREHQRQLPSYTMDQLITLDRINREFHPARRVA